MTLWHLTDTGSRDEHGRSHTLVDRPEALVAYLKGPVGNEVRRPEAVSHLVECVAACRAGSIEAAQDAGKHLGLTFIAWCGQVCSDRSHVPAAVTGIECGVCVRDPGHSGKHRITCVKPGSE